MLRLTLLAGLSGLVGHSLASYPGACHDSVARCFSTQHHEAAIYCAGLLVATETATTTSLYSTASLSSSTALMSSAVSYPSKPKFACAAKCHRPSRYVSACACIGVPQQTTTTTVTYVVVSTESAPITTLNSTSSVAYYTTLPSSTTTEVSSTRGSC